MAEGPTTPAQKYVKLSPQGETAYRAMVLTGFRTFLFWVFVGNVAGYTLTKFVPLFTKKLPAAKVTRYQRYAFWGPLILLSYHGYKTASMIKRRGMKQIIKDPDNTINEPKE